MYFGRIVTLATMETVMAGNRPGEFIVGKLCKGVRGFQGLMALAGGGGGSENGGLTPIRLIGARWFIRQGSGSDPETFSPSSHPEPLINLVVKYLPINGFHR